MGAISTAFFYIGVSMGYLYELMGTMIGSAVVPIALCITWRKCNGTGAVVGAIAGFIAGVAGWIGITSSLNNGVVDVDTTFGDYEMLTGNLLAIGVGGIITVAWSLLRPENFDWDITRAINVKVNNEIVESTTPSSPIDSPMQEKKEASYPEQNSLEEQPNEINVEQNDLQKAFRFASYSAIALVVILIFLIPLPLFFSSHGWYH